MAIFDCFCFFNELELLSLRMAEMSRAVDVVVLVEASQTFQRKPKPLFFDENRGRFRAHLSRIRHIVVDDLPDGTDAWTREHHQREAMRRGLSDASPDCTILISDVDEIIRPSAMRAARALGSFAFLSMAHRVYSLDRRPPEDPWVKAYAAPWSFVREMPCLSRPREIVFGFLDDMGLDRDRHVIAEAGWHLSWMGGASRIVTKLGAFSHTEARFSAWQDVDAVAGEIAAGRFFFSGEALAPAPLASLPHAALWQLQALADKGLLADPLTPAAHLAALFEAAKG